MLGLRSRPPQRGVLLGRRCASWAAERTCSRQRAGPNGVRWSAPSDESSTLTMCCRGTLSAVAWRLCPAVPGPASSAGGDHHEATLDAAESVALGEFEGMGEQRSGAFRIAVDQRQAPVEAGLGDVERCPHVVMGV